MADTLSTPPRRVLIWHVGWHKTGTTSIQNFFKQNQTQLLREAGLLYPSTGLHGAGHHDLARSLWPGQPEDPELWQRLGDELRGVDGWRTALISGEGLRWADPARLAALAEAVDVGPCDVRLMAYVRPPDLLVESLFAQQLKGGLWKGTFAGFAGHCRETGEPDYPGQLAVWQRQFPDATTVVRPFSPSQWPEGDLIRDFCRAAGREDVIGLEGLRLPEAVNRSPGPEMLSLVRELNRGLGDERRAHAAWGFGQLLEDLERRPCPATINDGKAHFFSPEQRRALRAEHEPAFRQLGIDFGAEYAQLPGSEGGELPEFGELPAERRLVLLEHTLQTAVLTLDRVCAQLEDSQSRCDRLAGDFRQEKQRREALEREHQQLVRRHREVSRQYARTWRRRMVDLRAWWRRWRKGAPDAA